MDLSTPVSEGVMLADMGPHSEPLRYLKLPTQFTRDLCWSNEPGKLALQTYFNPAKRSLGGDFNVQGLIPVLREEQGLHRFILIDEKDRFYMYEEWDGSLEWVKSTEDLEELDTYQEKVDWILSQIGDLETEPVYSDRHPAGHITNEDDGVTESGLEDMSEELSYVRLDPECMRYSCWTNDPNQLYLNVYFDKDKPNLADDFNVGGLQPVVKEKGSDQFILRDAKLRWYLWDAWEGELLRINEVWTTDFDSNEDIVTNILSQSTFIEEDVVAIWRDREED